VVHPEEEDICQQTTESEHKQAEVRPTRQEGENSPPTRRVPSGSCNDGAEHGPNTTEMVIAEEQRGESDESHSKSDERVQVVGPQQIAENCEIIV